MATLDDLSLQLRAAMDERQKQRLLEQARSSALQGSLSGGGGMAAATDAAGSVGRLDAVNEMQSRFYRPPVEQSLPAPATDQPVAKKAGKSKRGASGGKPPTPTAEKKPKERMEVPEESWRAEQMLYDLRSRVGRDVRDKDPATMDLERRLKEKAGLK